jgi:hypothetical protein
MRKKFWFLNILVIGISLLFLPGCKKVLDYISHNPNGTAANCRIEMITSNYVIPAEDYIFYDTARFAYNADDNPVSIEYTYPGVVYTYNRAFTYDQNKRLRTYIHHYGSPKEYVLFWHKYEYVNNNLIIDTTFQYAYGDFTVQDRPDSYDHFDITRYELDNYGRVIKEQGPGARANLTFTYDSNGNLIRPGVTYSNKTNIRQTSKVWMFLDRDYSINSPEGAASKFNHSKLPVKLNEMPFVFYDDEAFPFKDIVVSYKCK